MNNSLIKKENGFISRIKKWIKDKWEKIFNYNNGFKSLVSVDLGGHGRMFETEDKLGKKYLFKPAESKGGLSEPFRADIQEAIYKLQQEINPQGAISCFTITIDGLYGAVQEKIETSDSFNILNWQLYGGEIPKNILDGILQEYVVDWVSGNFDSHGSHFLVDTNGNVKCCDKEQAFRYLLDENSLKPDLNYNPNAYYGENEPIYNTIFKRFISGELENIDFNKIYEELERLNGISDEQYLGYFQSYVEKLSEEDKAVYFNRMLERKHNASLYIKEFVEEVLRMREQREKNENDKNNAEQQVELSTSTIEDSQLTIGDDDFTTPDTPSIFYVGSDENTAELEAKQRKKEEFLYRQLKKYGITKEEWAEIDKYKSSEYFLPTTLLHRIDLFKYNVPRYGDVFNNTDWLSPEKAIDSYCKIYSAMCKFAKRYNEELYVNRVGSNLFYDEMKKTGQTQSMLSFSKGAYQFKFAADKNGVILSNGILERGTPCIDFTELIGEDGEEEVLLPPFLDINYGDNETLVYDAYPEYNVHISQNNSQKLSDEERGKMELLRQSITNSNIPYEYYMNWYKNMRSNPSHQGNDEESVRLRQEFFKWQDKFKEYLQLRFREIENEINYPQLKPTDFLSWGIQRGRTGVERFKGVMQQVGDFFKQITNLLKEDGQDR